MNSILLIPFVLLAKLLIVILKTTGRGSGTALPGLLVGRYFPFVFQALVAQIPTVIAITGTNGKTTTQTMLSSILAQMDEFKVLRNKAGANLSQGILSQLLKEASLSGKLHVTHAIFEVEEATLPQIAQLLHPQIIAVTNLYRDQLDAYGEIDMTEKLIRDGIAQCPDASVVVNGDDPRASRLTQHLNNATYFTSLPDDFSIGVPYEGQASGTQHLTHQIVRATQVHVNSDLTTDIDVNGVIHNQPLQNLKVTVASPGFFHTYNALTAITIAKLLGVSDRAIVRGFQQFRPAFGRGEILVKRDGEKTVNYQILLVKNPASFTLNLELLKAIQPLKLMIAINDNTADSKDVSWLWDSKLELLNQATLDQVICTGIRAKEMKLRLKYALDCDRDVAVLDQIWVNENIRQAIDYSFKQASSGDTIYVLPTYTAMLEFRKAMGKLLD